MFCLTLQGDALEPDGCASSTHLGVNERSTHAMPISVDPLGERPILLKLHQRIGLMGGPVCTEPYYRQCHHPRKLNSLQEAQDM